MSWKNKKKKNTITKYSNYSIINKLKSEKKITDNTLNNINNISLEDLIAIKLEQSSRLLGGKLYNFPLWKAMPEICRDALLKYSYTACETKKDMARLLGIDRSDLYKFLKKHKTESYFN